MATCKECLHDGVCYMQEVCEDIEEQLREFGCDDFKDKTKYVEQKHGRWVERHDEATGTWHYDCPFCDDGYAMKMQDKNPPNYCGNCGAKMDEECDKNA